MKEARMCGGSIMMAGPEFALEDICPLGVILR